MERNANKPRIAAILGIITLVAGVSSVPKALAGGLTLTPEGISRGFKISTFASNFPTDDTNIYDLPGATGTLFTNKGLLVGDEGDGSVRLLSKDCDGQDASKIPPTAYYAVGLGGPTGMTKGKFQGKPRYYLATWQSEIFEINPDGTPIRKVVTVPGDFNFADIIASQFYQGLFVTAPLCMNAHDDPTSCPGGLFFVDPSTGGFIQDVSALYFLGFETDVNDNIYLTIEGYATLAFTPDFLTETGFFMPPDGVSDSVVGTGALSDHIFLFNNLANDVWEAKLDGSDLTMIASGGNYLGIPTIDPHNGSIVIGDTDEVVRISGGGLASADGETQVNVCH